MHFRAAFFGIFTFCLFQATISVKAQNSPSEIDTKTKPEEIKTAAVKHDKDGLSKPGKAALFSAILPGAGQVYNGHYWKVPVIYAVGAGIGYVLLFNHTQYSDYRQSYAAAIDDNPDTVPIKPGSPTLLKLRRDRYHGDRDVAFVVAVAAYGLQILEANIGAHLNEFDISDDLSLRWQPSIQYSYAGAAPVPTLSLNFHLKK